MKRRACVMVLAASLGAVAGPVPAGRHANLDAAVHAGELAAVHADDRLLNVLGSAVPGSAGSLVDDELNALLLAWRAEVEADPMPAGWS